VNRYASRKFLIAAASLVCAQWALFEQLIGAADWRVVVIAIVGLYGAANVGQKAVERKE
jgi:hypothetical protein